MSFDADEALDIFITEARELLESLEEGLLQLEADPDDAETINAIFRSAHTLKGSSGLFAFELKDAADVDRARYVDALELFGIGFSWGGYESLAMPVDPVRTVSKPAAPNLIRLHVGLEDAEDLIDDLDRAFATVS